MNKNRRISMLKRQTGSAKIFDACYATDEATYYTTTPIPLTSNVSQQSLSSHSSSNEDEDISLSSSEATSSPDVTGKQVPDVIFSPNTPNIHAKAKDTCMQQRELSYSPECKKINGLSLKQNEQSESESAAPSETIRSIVTLQNNRVSNLRASRSFSNLQKPIIPKTFRHIQVGGCENTRSYGDLASIVSNHSTEKDKLFLDIKREEFKRKASAGVINESLLKSSPMVRRIHNQRSVSFSIHPSSDRKSSIPCDILSSKQSGSLTNLSKLRSSRLQMSSENIHGSNLSLSGGGQAKIPLTFSQLNADDKFLRDVAAINDNDKTFNDSMAREDQNEDNQIIPSCYTSTPMRSNKDSQTLGRNLPRNVTFDQLNPVEMTPISKSRDNVNDKSTDSESVRRSVSTPSNMNKSEDELRNTTNTNNSSFASAAANNSKLSNKSSGSRSLKDSFSSTKSWLIKKAGWSKSNKNSKKSKIGKSNSFNTSMVAKDVSKENNILDNIDTTSDNTNEPIVSKQIIDESFDKPSSETMEEKSLFRSNSDDPSLNQKYELSDLKHPSTSNKSIEPIPQLVINSEEISLTSQDISKNFSLASPNQSYNDPSEIRRRSSSLGHRFDDVKKMQLAKNAFEIWKGKKQSTDNLSFSDRKSTTSSMCTMCGNPECKGLNGTDSVSVSSISYNDDSRRPCVRYIGEGKLNFVSSLALNVIADNQDISITSSTSEIEANNNNESSTNYKRWHSGSQKSSGTISKLPNSKRSLRYNKKPKEQVYWTLERPGSKNLVSKHSRRNLVDKNLLAGVKSFNLEPKRGLKELARFGFLDPENPEEIAYFLFHEARLSKKQIGEFLGSRADLNCQALSFFVKNHMFTGLLLVEALRQFLWSFRLPGEAQQIDRIMEAFAAHYCSQNPGLFQEQDTCYVLSFSIIMLNTALHNPNVKTKITLEQYINQNRGMNSGKDLPRDMLVLIYNNIKAEKFNIPEENYDDLMYTFFSPDKEGWLQKQGGSWKNWKRRWFVLSDRCLYYFQHTAEKLPKGMIPLENVKVQSIPDIDGKRFCFEIRNEANTVVKGCKTDSHGTVVQGKHKSYKISASSDEEKSEWIECIKESIKEHKFYDIVAAKKSALKRKSLKHERTVLNQSETQDHNNVELLSANNPN